MQPEVKISRQLGRVAFCLNVYNLCLSTLSVFVLNSVKNNRSKGWNYSGVPKLW